MESITKFEITLDIIRLQFELNRLGFFATKEDNRLLSFKHFANYLKFTIRITNIFNSIVQNFSLIDRRINLLQSKIDWLLFVYICKLACFFAPLRLRTRTLIGRFLIAPHFRFGAAAPDAINMQISSCCCSRARLGISFRYPFNLSGLQHAVIILMTSYWHVQYTGQGDLAGLFGITNELYEPCSARS